MNKFELVHVGINTNSPEDAKNLADNLCEIFNLNYRAGNKSEFAGNYFECMKKPFLGENGHIAMQTDDLEEAFKELKSKGIKFREDTVAYNEDGKLKNIYIDGEFGGFAIHILQK